MSKVYLIGTSISEAKVAEIRVAANIPTDTEVICVSSVEEIPIEERPITRPLEVHKLTLCEKLPDPICWEKPNKKVKGWQRPYKFHR